MKKLSRILLVLAIIFNFSINLYASETTEIPETTEAPETTDEYYDEKIRGLEDSLDSLRNQLDDMYANPITSKSPEKPRIALVSPASVSLYAGRSSTTEVTIKNVTSYYAYNVLTQVKATADYPIIASFENNSNFSSLMTNNSNLKMRLNITADNSAKTGVYSITLTHTYSNEQNEELSSESVISVRVINDSASPSVVIENINVSNTRPLAGEVFKLNASVVNNSNVSAKDVQVSVEGLKPDEIFLSNSTNLIDISNFPSGTSKAISINLTSNPKIKSGSYMLNFKLTFRDNDDKEYVKNYAYNISVFAAEETATSASKSKPEIYIEKIDAPPETYAIGENFTMTLIVKNASETTGKNIKITAVPEGEGAIVPKSSSIMIIPSLEPYATKQLNFTFAATSSAKTQNYVIGYNLDYETGEISEDGKFESISFKQYQGINIANLEADRKAQEEKEKEKVDETEKPEEKTSVPKIIISEYSSNPIIVTAGSEFDLALTFLNTSSVETIKNIKAFFTVDEGTEEKGNVFSPVQSSNTFYVDSIEPKGQVMRSVRLYTIPDASPKTYKINVNFEYEDSKNNEIKSTEIIGINVKQNTRLETGEIIVEESASIGMPFGLSFQLFNSGKVRLSNLKIELEGPFESDQKLVYIGISEPGSSEYFDAQLSPLEVGMLEGKIKISYEDDVGVVNEEVKVFSVNVMDNNFDSFGIDGPVDPETGLPIIDSPTVENNNLKYYLAGGGTLLVIAAIVIFLLRRRKKQRSLDFDE